MLLLCCRNDGIQQSVQCKSERTARKEHRVRRLQFSHNIITNSLHDLEQCI